MERYFQIKIIKTEGTCPRYSTCRTGRDLPAEFCATYRCNTFYQIDTIKLYLDSPWGPAAIAKCSVDSENQERRSGVDSVVEAHFKRAVVSGNGRSNGNGKSNVAGIASRPRSCIS